MVEVDLTRGVTRARNIGLPDVHLGDKKIQGGYDTTIALKVLEQLAEGVTLKEICDSPSMPTRGTVHRWVNIHPEFARAFMAARELSAMAFEEQALALAKKLYTGTGHTSVIVRAFEVAMGQLRWSAARRDPKRYGQQNNQVLVVPIQINTTLDMGSGSDTGPNTIDHPDIYKIEARVVAEEPEGPLTVDPAEAPESVTNPYQGVGSTRAVSGRKPGGTRKKRLVNLSKAASRMARAGMDVPNEPPEGDE